MLMRARIRIYRLLSVDVAARSSFDRSRVPNSSPSECARLPRHRVRASGTGGSASTPKVRVPSGRALDLTQYEPKPAGRGPDARACFASRQVRRAGYRKTAGLMGLVAPP